MGSLRKNKIRGSLTPDGSGIASPLRGAEMSCLRERPVSHGTDSLKFKSYTYSGVMANPGDTRARAASSHLAIAIMGRSILDCTLQHKPVRLHAERDMSKKSLGRYPKDMWND